MAGFARDLLNKTLDELNRLKSARKTNDDSLYTANRALNQKYQKLFVDYQIAIEEKESLIKALADSPKAKETQVQELDLSQSQTETELTQKLRRFQNEVRNYKIRLDSILSIQDDKEWEIAELKQKRDALMIRVDELESLSI